MAHPLHTLPSRFASVPRPVYMDCHATTPVDPRVVQAVIRAMTVTFGNPNSVDHAFGEEAGALVAEAREELAELVGADAEMVHFTSGSSEGILLAVRHAIATRSRPERPLRVAASCVEHRAVLDALAAAEAAGEAVVRYLPVDECARLDLDALREECANGIDLVCVMAANNEVGTLYPVEEVARLAVEYGARTLVDATQAAGRIALRTVQWGVTYLTLSAHKLYGPKGVGAVVTSHQAFRRSHGTVRGVGDGTPNVPGIAGLGEACRLRSAEMEVDEPRIAAQRDRMESLLLDLVPELIVNGDRVHRLSHNLHVSVPGVPNDAVLARLRRLVAISSGAACMSGAQTRSHVLRAMGLSAALQEGALRIGLGRFTTDEEVDCAAEHIANAVQATRDAMRAG